MTTTTISTIYGDYSDYDNYDWYDEYDDYKDYDEYEDSDYDDNFDYDDDYDDYNDYDDDYDVLNLTQQWMQNSHSLLLSSFVSYIRCVLPLVRQEVRRSPQQWPRQLSGTSGLGRTSNLP